MKLRYLFASLATAAALLFATGCAEETLGDLGVIKVDNTNVVLPEKGGDAKIVITATEPWSIVESTIPEGVTVAPLSGGAGQTSVIFSSAAAKKDVNGEIKIVCGGKVQFLALFQPGDPALKPQFGEFKAGQYWIVFNTGEKYVASKPVGCTIDDSGSYAYVYCADAAGTFPALTSTAANVWTFEAVDGGFVMKDSNNGYIYQDAAGKYNNFYQTSKKDNAMVWTVEQISETEFEITSSQGKTIQYTKGYSSWGAYSVPQDGGVRPYLVAAKDPAPEVLKVETTKFDVDKEGGVLTVPALINADNVKVDYEANWLRYTGTNAEGFTFTVDANPGGGRSATINVSANLGNYSGAAVITVNQDGNIEEVNVGQILAAEVNASTWYKVTGVVCNLQTGDYGNFDLVDGTGSIYVYGLTATQVAKNDKSFPTLGIKEGDVVTLIGTRAEFNGTAQIGGPAYYVSHISVTPATVAEFNAAPVAADKWYKLTGTVTDGTAQAGHKFDLAQYGNFDLVDETGAVYVYGLTATMVEKNDKSCGSLGLAAGDVITIIGTRAEYNGAIQVGGPAFFVAKEEGGNQGGGNQGGETGSTMSLTNAEIVAAMTSSDTNYYDYTISSTSGTWTVNASRNKANTFLQCRGKKGSYIMTPAFDKDIVSVTLHFSEAKAVYSNNVYCVFPESWTAPTEDAAYPADGNVGTATTDGSYSVTIPVNAGHKQVKIAITGGTYAYYLDHIDVAF